MITLNQIAEGTVPTPDTGAGTIFIDSADGLWKTKDDGGVTSPVGGGGGGSPPAGTGVAVVSAGAWTTTRAIGAAAGTDIPDRTAADARYLGIGANAVSATLAASATALATPRTINGTSFDGTGNITVTAAGSTLTGLSGTGLFKISAGAAQAAAGTASDTEIEFRDDRGATFDGGASAPAVNSGVQVPNHRDGVVKAALIVATDTNGDRVTDSCTVTVYKISAGDSSTQLGTVSLSAAKYNNDSTLSGWVTSVSAGETIKFKLTSTTTTATKVSISLKIARS